MLDGREVTVLGAGIGGLTVALACAQRGAQVRVIEQAEELRDVGAGIQISQNAMVVLDRLDLGGNVRSCAVRSGGTLLCDFRAGKPVLMVPPPAAGPTHYVHRADLIGVLAEAAKRQGVQLDLGRRVTGLAHGADAVRLSYASGATEDVALLVAADGVRGPGRSLIDGRAEPKFSGQVAWRAVVPWEGAPADAVAQLAMGPGHHVVTYPLRGGAFMNLVAVEERRDWRDESWSSTGAPEDLRTRFARFGGQAGEVLARVRDVHLWGLFGHPVARRWHQGRLVLLGDAAHPTLPFMAQGACLAIEDAYVLVEELASGPGAFARYESRRARRAARVVEAAAKNTWRFHMHAPLRQIAQTLLRTAGQRAAPRIDWVYAHDVTREKRDAH